MKALSQVPRGSLQVIPYYARIAATLNTVFPEIALGAFRLLLARMVTQHCSGDGSLRYQGFKHNKRGLGRAGILSKLQADFRAQQRHKDATSRTLESRLRTARFLGVLQTTVHAFNTSDEFLRPACP